MCGTLLDMMGSIYTEDYGALDIGTALVLSPRTKKNL